MPISPSELAWSPLHAGTDPGGAPAYRPLEYSNPNAIPAAAKPVVRFNNILGGVGMIPVGAAMTAMGALSAGYGKFHQFLKTNPYGRKLDQLLAAGEKKLIPKGLRNWGVETAQALGPAGGDLLRRGPEIMGGAAKGIARNLNPRSEISYFGPQPVDQAWDAYLSQPGVDGWGRFVANAGSIGASWPIQFAAFGGIPRMAGSRMAKTFPALAGYAKSHNLARKANYGMWSAFLAEPLVTTPAEERWRQQASIYTQALKNNARALQQTASALVEGNPLVTPSAGKAFVNAAGQSVLDNPESRKYLDRSILPDKLPKPVAAEPLTPAGTVMRQIQAIGGEKDYLPELRRLEEQARQAMPEAPAPVVSYAAMVQMRNDLFARIPEQSIIAVQRELSSIVGPENLRQYLDAATARYARERLDPVVARHLAVFDAIEWAQGKN